MRDIKFRFRVEDEGMTLEKGKYFYQNNQYLSSFLRRIYNHYGVNHPTYLKFQVGERLELYTGLKDKNGVEIYEGDIIDKGYCQEMADVIFLDGMYYTKPINLTIEDFKKTSDYTSYEECITFLCQSRANNMQIIGNIYEKGGK